MLVILSEGVVCEADDNAVEEPAPSEAKGAPRTSNHAAATQGVLPAPISEHRVSALMRASQPTQTRDPSAA